MLRFLIFMALSLALIVPNAFADQAQAPQKRLTLKERIKKAVKKAATKVKKAAKKAAKVTKKAAKKVAKKAAKATKKAIVATKKAAKKAAVSTKKATKKAAVVVKKAVVATKKAAKKVTIATKKVAKKAAVAVKKATKKAVKATKKVFGIKTMTQVHTPKKVLTAPKGTVLSMILKNGCVRVCVRSDIPPFGYFKGETLQGFDITLAKKIVSGISIRYNKTLNIQWTVINAKSRIPSLQQGRCDLVVAAFSKTVARTKLIGLSNIYLRTHQVLISRVKMTRNPPILASVSGTTSQATTIKGARVAQFFNYNEILEAMKRGLVDYVLTDHPIAKYLLRNSKGYKLQKVLAQKENYAVGTHLYQIYLRKEVNAVLNYLSRSGHLAYFQRQWIH